MIIAAFLVTAPLLLLAQPHPNNNGLPPGPGNTRVGGATAPIGSGTFILLILAAAYAGRKVYVVRDAAEE